MNFKYSKDSIIRPGHSRLKEFEKKYSTGSKNPDQDV